MKTLLNCTTPRVSLKASTIALVSALGLVACYDTLDVPPSDAAGGSGAGAPTFESGGSASPGASGAAVAGSDVRDGGRGGAGPEDGGEDAGGTPGIGGSNRGGSAPANGGTPAAGGSAPELEAGSSGGTDASGGTTNVAGGPSAGGTGGEEPAPAESICFDEEGQPVPYDYSFGVTSEYAFELSMNCDVGGYLMPLVLADPEQLTQVNAFVADATDWYRAEILRCDGEATAIGEDAYGLLPVSESAELSGADFDASLALFTAVMDRHDGQPDGVSKHKKDKIKQRIKSIKHRAVHGNKDALTKTLSEPDCMPSAPPADG